MRLENLRVVPALVMALSLSFTPGCLSVPDIGTDDPAKEQEDPGGGSGGGGDDGGSGGGGDSGGNPAELAQRAYFVLQGSDLRSDDWPDAFAEYDVFVCNPSLDASQIATIRADFPDAVLLAYTNAQDMQWNPSTENPYLQALAAAIDESMLLRDLETGQVLRIQGYDGTPGSGIPMWVPQTNSVDALVQFHVDQTMQVDWDGLYVDQCNAEMPNWRSNAVLEQSSQFDFDGDGFPDRIADLKLAYANGRTYLTSQLRAAFPDAVIVGNSGGALLDPALNGITLEGAGDRFSELEARTILEEAASVARGPWTAVLWVTTQESVEVTAEISEDTDGVYFGTVSYFDARL